MVDLGVLNDGLWSAAYAVSADGNVVVGFSVNTANYPRAFRWTPSGGMVSLGVLNGGLSSYANDVSAKGDVVVGQADDGAAVADRAFRWTERTGMVSLGVLDGGTFSGATGVSANGDVVVGFSNDSTAINSWRAFRWTRPTGMVSLGALNGGTKSAATGVSADGTVVVGNASDGATGSASRGFRWTAATGMQTVEDWLRANGVKVPNDITSWAKAVDATGNVVVGDLADGQAFIARVEPTPGNADNGATDNGGNGLLALDDALTASLSSPAAVSLTALRTGDLVLHGEHGRPLSYRVGTGQRTVWVSGDLGQDDHDPLDGDVALGEVGAGYNFGPVQTSLAVGRTWADQNLTDNGDMNAAGDLPVGRGAVAAARGAVGRAQRLLPVGRRGRAPRLSQRRQPGCLQRLSGYPHLGAARASGVGYRDQAWRYQLQSLRRTVLSAH
jgi:probable HAF family extracellular repeat protein